MRSRSPMSRGRRRDAAPAMRVERRGDRAGAELARRALATRLDEQEPREHAATASMHAVSS